MDDEHPLQPSVARIMSEEPVSSTIEYSIAGVPTEMVA